MPEMSGVEFLNKAIAIYPDARRVLLTAYADTDAAIQAINQARIHHYLLKPWDPPEEQLYPVLDDLLEDWQAGYRPVFDGVRVLGHRWSPRSYAVARFSGPQSGSLSLAGCGSGRAGQGSPRSPGSRQARLPEVPGRDLHGQLGAFRSVDGGTGGKARPAHDRDDFVLRFADRWRRAGRTGRRGVWRIRRA